MGGIHGSKNDALTLSLSLVREPDALSTDFKSQHGLGIDMPGDESVDELRELEKSNANEQLALKGIGAQFETDNFGQRLV